MRPIRGYPYEIACLVRVQRFLCVYTLSKPEEKKKILRTRRSWYLPLYLRPQIDVINFRARAREHATRFFRKSFRESADNGNKNNNNSNNKNNNNNYTRSAHTTEPYQRPNATLAEQCTCCAKKKTVLGRCAALSGKNRSNRFAVNAV